MKRRLFLNTASNMMTLFLKLAITFIMTPILIKNLGNYDYGIWEMVGAIVGYMGMLDLGIRPAISRFAARFIALNDEASQQKLFATAWFFLLVVGALIFCLLCIWGIFFSASMSPIGEPEQRYTLLLLLIGIQLLISFPAYTAESFMEAYQEYYLKNNITIINSIIGFFVIYIYIKPENALVLLALVNTIGVSAKYLFLVWYVKYKRRFLAIKINYFSYSELKVLLSFSVKTLIQGISSRIENATDSLVIGLVLGPATVPFYSIPANLMNHIRGISITLTHVFMPYLSGLSALNDKQKIQSVYLSTSKLMVSMSIVMLIGASMLGQPFIQLWVGDEIAKSAQYLIYIICAFTVLPLFNPLSNRYLTAIDKHGFLAKWQPVTAIANLILSLFLVKPLGIIGVAIGSLLPALVFQPILLSVCCRHLDMSVAHYLKAVIFPWILPSAVMIFSMYLLIEWLVIDNYTVLLFSAFLSTLLFFLSGLFCSLSKKERKQIYSLFKRT